MAKKWLDSIEKQKRRSNVCDRQTDRQTDGHLAIRATTALVEPSLTKYNVHVHVFT